MISDKQLDEATAQLPRELRPSRDLWAALEQELPTRQPADVPADASDRKPPLYRVLLASAAMLGALWVVDWQLLQPEPASAPAPAPVPAVAETDTFPISGEESVVLAYEQQLAAPRAWLNDADGVAGSWGVQLTVWGQARQQVHNALRMTPDEPALLRQLERLYQQEASFLQTIAAVDTDLYYSGSAPWETLQ